MITCNVCKNHIDLGPYHRSHQNMGMRDRKASHQSSLMSMQVPKHKSGGMSRRSSKVFGLPSDSRKPNTKNSGNSVLNRTFLKQGESVSSKESDGSKQRSQDIFKKFLQTVAKNDKTRTMNKTSQNLGENDTPSQIGKSKITESQNRCMNIFRFSFHVTSLELYSDIKFL